MFPFNTELFVFTLALIGTVITISALLSGLVDRSGFPQVAVFLALGAIIGPFGLNLADVNAHSPILRVVGTLSLVLVLFTDAVSLNLNEVRRQKRLSLLVLGPGTFLSALLIAFISWGLLGLSAPAALVLGAALASTDPVLLRGVLRKPGLDRHVRQALRLEGGMNDAVLLPLVLVGMAWLRHGRSPGATEWAHLGMNILILSPAAGAVVALAGIGMLALVRRRIGVRRDYESIYSLGLAFAAYAAAESTHGSGFLAAFAAGLTISALDVDLCDCFLEYGQTTAEMALMFSFVLFGVSVIWHGLGILALTTLLFIGAVFASRFAAFIPALLPTELSWANRLRVAWFGPRGLSSLLLILLPVFAGLPQSGYLLTICCLVVLFSVLLHGLSPNFFIKSPPDAGAPDLRETAVRPASLRIADEIGGLNSDLLEGKDPEKISVEEVKALEADAIPVFIADARKEKSFRESDENIPGAVRVDPEQSVRSASQLGIPKTAIMAVLCT
ncbi:MAG TPA: cation:proton antiporter [Bryobacteraceae bacterium]